MSRLSHWIRCERRPPNDPLPEVDFSTWAIEAFLERAKHSDPHFAAFRSALKEGAIMARAGLRAEPLTETGIDHDAAGILYYVVKSLGAATTIEIGFGLGVATIAIMLAKNGLRDERHVTVDPYRMGSDGGVALLDHLKRTYGRKFLRVWERSEIVLPRMVAAKGWCDLAFIDGDHHFDGVLVDFFYCDRLCRVGGLIILDDIDYPPVETALNFIRANRKTYAVAEVGRFAILKKLAADDRRWWHFRPFAVPDRLDWAHRRAADEPRKRA